MHRENIPGGGFAENEITVWIFSENKDAPRISSDIFRPTLRIFCGNILKNICLKKEGMLRVTGREYDIKEDLGGVDVGMMTRKYI